MPRWSVPEAGAPAGCVTLVAVLVAGGLGWHQGQGRLHGWYHPRRDELQRILKSLQCLMQGRGHSYQAYHGKECLSVGGDVPGLSLQVHFISPWQACGI